MYNNTGLCGDLVSVGSEGTNYSCQVDCVECDGLRNTDLEDLLAQLSDAGCRGLLSIEGGRWRLSDPAGLALSNAVLRVMVVWWEQRAPSIGAAPAPPAGANRSAVD